MRSIVSVDGQICVIFGAGRADKSACLGCTVAVASNRGGRIAEERGTNVRGPGAAFARSGEAHAVPTTQTLAAYQPRYVRLTASKMLRRQGLRMRSGRISLTNCRFLPSKN